VSDRAVFTAIVYMPTAHRRFTAWTRAGLWPRLHRAVLDALGTGGQVDWASAIVDAAAVRAKKGGHATGPDRGRMRGKLHVLSDAAGLPLVIAMSIIQRWRPKRSPDSTAGRAMRGTIPRRRNQVRCSAERYALSARIFRTDAGPAARRLTIRYERHGHLFNAFLVLAAAITCSEPSVAPGQADQLGETSLLWPGLHRRSAFGASRIRPRRNPPRASSRPTPHHRRRGD
jgi:hypothetical protein